VRGPRSQYGHWEDKKNLLPLPTSDNQ
jgi:hypothetical protein